MRQNLGVAKTCTADTEENFGNIAQHLKSKNDINRPD